ncbi:hypothetical protein FALCPG4_013968 [Fusarium falciforme]
MPTCPSPRCTESSNPPYVSVKIPALFADPKGETDKLHLIQNANPSHEGYSFIHTPLDHFDLSGPEDIKNDNVLMGVEDDTILEEFANFYKKHGQHRHIRDDRLIVYLSDSDFGELGDSVLIPKLSDFNRCFSQPLEDNVNIQPIQPHSYRTPEVLLGCPWTESVDIWNLGVLMWNMLEDVDFFGRPAGKDGQYDVQVHLAEMGCLLGPPPEQVIETEQYFRKAYFKGTITNPRGRSCATMTEYWGGPFFDEIDQIYRAYLVREGKTISDMATELTGQEKDDFVDFAGNMLQWIPEDRMTAKELQRHPFLEEVDECFKKD